MTFQISLTPFFTNFTFDGQSTARLVANVATDVITLHAKRMKIDEDSLSVSENDQDVTKAGFGFDEAREFFKIYLAQPVTAGSTITIYTRYVGELSDDLAGFYRSSYEADGETRYLAITQFQSTDARRAFPCLDEPAMKAVFKITLGRPTTYSSASNMPIAQRGVPMQGQVRK